MLRAGYLESNLALRGDAVKAVDTYFCFFSAGLRIWARERRASRLGEPTWNEHSRLSSTLIMAPALSNSPQ